MTTPRDSTERISTLESQVKILERRVTWLEGLSPLRKLSLAGDPDWHYVGCAPNGITRVYVPTGTEVRWSDEE